MDVARYSAFFLVSTIKFLFAPFGGPAAQLTFFETYLSCVAGAFVSGTIFYFLSEYFLNKAKQKQFNKLQEANIKGVKLPVKKKFTKLNRSIIRLKRSLGIYGISFFAPLFMSIPVGTIVTAKFFGKQKITYPLILTGFLINGLITTGLAYGIANLF